MSDTCNRKRGSAITPTSDDDTDDAREIGRSMKKCGKFTGMRNAECGMRNWERGCVSRF
jgi:hypothetical protein